MVVRINFTYFTNHGPPLLKWSGNQITIFWKEVVTRSVRSHILSESVFKSSLEAYCVVFDFDDDLDFLNPCLDSFFFGESESPAPFLSSIGRFFKVISSVFPWEVGAVFPQVRNSCHPPFVVIRRKEINKYWHRWTPIVKSN